MSRRPRVVVALPDRVERTLVANWLSENQCKPLPRSARDAAARDLDAGACDLVIVDAIWAVGNALKTSGRRPAPVPSILVGDVKDQRALSANGQAMYLARPIDLAVLSCFVSMALMDDSPVRRSRRKTVQRFEAFVNDVPAGIVDVSPEGLRLELPRVPPPFFAVRVPLVGVAFIAKRMWTKSPSKPGPAIWCGGALSNNRPGSEEAWRSFVDTVPVITPAGPARSSV